MMKVPGRLIDQVSLIGPKERIKERLTLWLDSPVNTLNITVFDTESLRTMVELVAEVS